MNKIKLIAFILLIVTLSTSIFNFSKTKNIHVDEHAFLRGGYFFDLVADNNFTSRRWMNFDSYDMPKFAELFYGAIVRFSFGMPAKKYLYDSGFTDRSVDAHYSPYYANLSNSYKEISELSVSTQNQLKPLIFVRQFSVMISVGVLVLIFLIGNLIGGWIFGFLSLFFLGRGALFQESMMRVMGEAPLIFLNLLYLLLFLVYIKKLEIGSFKNKLLFLLTAIIAGLSFSTKLNGIINIIHFGLFLIFSYWGGLVDFWEKFPLASFNYRTFVDNQFFNIWFFINQGLSFLFLSFAVFVIINPFVWGNPWIQTSYMVKHRAIVINRQQEYVTSDTRITTFRQKIEKVYFRVFDSDADYGLFSVEQFKLSFNLILFLMGFVFMLIVVEPDILKLFPIKIRRKLQYVLFQSIGLEPTATLSEYNISTNKKVFSGFFLWIISWIVITWANLPLDWDRYYLPIVIAVGFVQVFAVVVLLRVLVLILTIVIECIGEINN